MILKAFAVYDRQAERFSPPFFLRTVGEAQRTFVNCFRRQDTQMASNPHDYEFHHIGTWDEETAEFAENTKNRILMSGKQAQLAAKQLNEELSDNEQIQESLRDSPVD